jgi:hypothetical protein
MTLHHQRPFTEGMELRVIRKPRMPNDAKPPFAVGDVVLCERVTDAGSILTNKHGGLFNPRTFERA